ncbi:pyruvate formate lyase family protein [Candidatus Hydrogenedentota bacterium]
MLTTADISLELSSRLKLLLAERKECWQAQKPSWKAHNPKWVDGRPSVVNKSQAFTEAYRESEGYAPILRAAKAILAECENMPLHIAEDELIVGYFIPSIASFRYFQGLYAYRDFDHHGWTDSEIAEAEKALEFWKGRTSDEAIRRIPGFEDYLRERDVWNGGMSGGHHVIGYGKLVRLGIPGLRAEIEKYEKKNAIDAESRDFYEAMRTMCDAFHATAIRYGKYAADLATRCQDAVRAEELQQIAGVCERIAYECPETLQEAAQLVQIAHMIDGYEDLGRVDQYLYPFYRADMDAGRITFEEAADIVGSLMLRLRYSASVIFLSGLTPEGEDGTNELSWLILELAGKYNLPTPEILVRHHSGTPREFMHRAYELMIKAELKPSFYNDEVVIPVLMSDGVSLEDARDYAAVGCNHIVIPGRSNTAPSRLLLLTQCLLLALNDGALIKNGEPVGPKTGVPEDLKSLEDVWNAYDTQMRYFAGRLKEKEDACDKVRMEHDAYALRSLLNDDCVKTGVSFAKGGSRYNNSEINTDGIANTVDSLMVIKMLVFDKKMLTLSELVDAIKADFEGHEDLRQTIINHVPKFGNDDDYVDEIGVRVNDHVMEVLAEQKLLRGGHCVATPIVGMGVQWYRDQIGSASPDGRRASDPLVDSIGPAQGRDRNGPTAMLNSVTKLNVDLAVCGVTLNMKFHPSVVTGEGGADIIENLVSAYFAKGGMHIQPAVVDDEVLKEAQLDPEKHRDLVVRVAGYNATFVDLSRHIQDEIISRTAVMS